MSISNNLIYLVVGILTLGGLLYAEKKNSPLLVRIFKPLTSLIFILTAVSGGLNNAYAILIFCGLVCGMLGDVFLISKVRIWFFLGLVSFLVGHIFYIFAFSHLSSFSSLNLPILLLIILMGVIFLVFFWGKLENMRLPVVIYILIISVMLWRSWAVFFNADLSEIARALIAFGATSFYVSDIFVANERFMKKSFFNKLAGLPLYYLGQFMLALSIAASFSKIY